MKDFSYRAHQFYKSNPTELQILWDFADVYFKKFKIIYQEKTESVDEKTEYTQNTAEDCMLASSHLKIKLSLNPYK